MRVAQEWMLAAGSVPANNFSLWGAFASNLFSWENAKQAQIDAWTRDITSAWARRPQAGRLAPVFTHGVGVAVTNAAESGASTIAGA